MAANQQTSSVKVGEVGKVTAHIVNRGGEGDFVVQIKVGIQVCALDHNEALKLSEILQSAGRAAGTLGSVGTETF
jgi:hydrogenase maturation factor